MTILKQTISLCPTCLCDVPATIYEINGMAVMRKVCPEHGLFHGIVERDSEFYKLYDHPENKIFDGHFIDVTSRCNLSCSYCYHPNNGGDVQKETIWAQASNTDAPIYLTGGEPTLRSDLPEIIAGIKQKTYLPTNGIGLLDDSYLCQLFDVISCDAGFKGIALSYHDEYPELFEMVMDRITAHGHKITSVIFTITNPAQLLKCLEIADKWADSVFCFRVHCVTGLWDCDHSGLFLSDVIPFFDGEMMPEQSKTIWALGVRNSKVWAFCHWDTINTLDKGNTSCGPYATAMDAKTYHLTEAFIRNGHTC
jgi:hypothetical protein